MLSAFVRACNCITVTTSAHDSTFLPHLERQGGNRPSCKCRDVPRTLAQTPQLERQGGNRPLWKRHGAMRPRKCRNSSGPGGHPPPVFQPCTLGEVLVTCRSSIFCLSVGVSVWLRPRALRTAGARALPHTLFATSLGVPMWHARSHILCLFIVTMRPCAPSDISEEGSGYESG